MRLLLVDDEEYSREGILSVVSWEELGINEIHVAANGSEGLEAAAWFKPDIVLADIRMPRMDGLTMCHRIRELVPDCSFILISGYSDKEYLKSAIRLSAVNYLEKPFLPKELVESLRQAITRRTSQAVLSTCVREDQMPVVENHIATALLRHHRENDPLWGQISSLYPQLPTAGHWITLLISFSVSPERGNELSKELFRFIRSHFPAETDGSLLLGQKQDTVAVLHLSVQPHADLTIRLGSLCHGISDFLNPKCPYNISIGTLTEGLKNIHLSYEAAMAGLQQCFFYGPGQILSYKAADAPAVFSFTPEDIDYFEKLLKNSTEKEVLTYIRLTCRKIQKYNHTLISTVKDFFSQLARRLYYYSDSFILKSFSTGENLADSINRIWNARYLQDLEAYMYERIQVLFREISTLNTDTLNNPLPCKIKNYIDANYCSEDLCLQSLSDYFNITASYICIIFKKQYQKTVNQYINEKRIEKSIDYLENSNRKVKEISTMIGYPDSNYFIKVFKKITGVTPKEYRRK